MKIKKIEVEQVVEISNLVWNVMVSAKQLPSKANNCPEIVKRLLHDELKKEMKDDFLMCYGALVQEKLVGIIGYEPITNRISYLYVLPEYQKQRIGTKLLDIIVSSVKEQQTIEVRAHKDAVAMYEKYGFKRNNNDGSYSIGMEYVLRRK